MLESLLSLDLTILATIIAIDIVMSGDNAIIIGMAAAGLEPELRRRAIIYGIAGATVLRILFAAVAFQLLAIIGLTLAGGLLLAWVCWRMWRDLRNPSPAALNEAPQDGDPAARNVRPTKTLRGAMINIIVADVSMSLDNILAVAGAAGDHLGMLVFGLILSIALMAVAATYIARLLERHRWIAYVGLVIVGYVAVDMIWRGTNEIRALVLAFAQVS
ncbi:MAG: TerC family protein [Alphaproteobacteria bacterium]|nr:TerC family protein [Alphaproteobacteria bacterium]